MLICTFQSGGRSTACKLNVCNKRMFQPDAEWIEAYFLTEFYRSAMITVCVPLESSLWASISIHSFSTSGSVWKPIDSLNLYVICNGPFQIHSSWFQLHNRQVLNILENHSWFCFPSKERLNRIILTEQDTHTSLPSNWFWIKIMLVLFFLFKMSGVEMKKPVALG